MISKTEIKKQGWKPLQKKDVNELDKFSMKVHGRQVYLTIEGETVSIIELAPNGLKEAQRNPLTAIVTLFHGHIPKRYELQIIMRCLGIG